jgi:hypothetical protein
MDWQSYIALGIVTLTLGIFIYRLLSRKRPEKSCGKNCSCAPGKKPE